MSHVFDPEKAEKLEDPSRLEQLGKEELLKHIDHGDTVVDLGSGTGFYTDILAEKAGKVYGVDFEAEMHSYYRDKGLPENVELVQASVHELPFENETSDVLVSINTFHEFPEETVKELYRVLKNDGILFVHDWSSKGNGDEGPPTEHRYCMKELSEELEDAGFEVEGEEHGEYFRIIARR